MHCYLNLLNIILVTKYCTYVHDLAACKPSLLSNIIAPVGIVYDNDNDSACTASVYCYTSRRTFIIKCLKNKKHCSGY